MLSIVQQERAGFQRDTRFPVSYCATGEHRKLGKIVLQIEDISVTGILISAKAGIEKGDTVLLRLPGSERRYQADQPTSRMAEIGWRADGPLLGGRKLKLDVALVSKPFLFGKCRHMFCPLGGEECGAQPKFCRF